MTEAVIAVVHRLNVSIDDLERARDFYGRVLGLPQIERLDGVYSGLWFGCGSDQLHLSPQPGRRLQRIEGLDRAVGHVAFTMSGTLADIVDLLRAERIPFRRGSAGLPQVCCRDPAGNVVELNTDWTR